MGEMRGGKLVYSEARNRMGAECHGKSAWETTADVHHRIDRLPSFPYAFTGVGEARARIKPRARFKRYNSTAAKHCDYLKQPVSTAQAEKSARSR